MDNLVLIRLEQATEALTGILQSPDAFEKMDMIETLLEVREVCLKRFDSDIRPVLERPDVRKRLEKVLSMDRGIAEGMQRLQQEAQSNLLKIRQTRQAQSKYDGYAAQESIFVNREF